MKPALTAEEWAPVGMKCRIEPMGNDHKRGWYVIDGVAIFEYIEQHALAALALYNQPYGFTQEDVKALRAGRTIQEDNSYSGNRYDEDKWAAISGFLERFDSLADRIEALLRPKERIAAPLPPPSEITGTIEGLSEDTKSLLPKESRMSEPTIITGQYQTLYRLDIQGDLHVQGKVRIEHGVITGDLIALDADPEFFSCRVGGNLVHPNLAKVKGCVFGINAARIEVGLPKEGP